MEKRKKKKRGYARRIIAAAATLVIIAAAVTLFLYRDKLTSEGLRGLFGGESAAVDTSGAAYAYEAGSNEVFAAAGNGLAIASGSGMQLLDSDGYTVTKQIFSLSAPAVAASGVNCAFYDVGGTTLRVADFGGTITNLDSPEPIISVSVNDNGWLAVVTEERGHKGLVTVYDAELSPVYMWHSGSAYVLSARISPDNKSMAALTVNAEGGGVSIFSLSSEEPTAVFEARGELLIDLCYISQNRLCALSESRALFLDAKLEEQGSYDFAGRYLTDYNMDGNGFVALLLGKYRSGNAGTLVTLGQDGSLTGQLDIQRDLVSLSASGSRLLAYYSDELVLYSPELERQGSREDVVGLKGALLRDKGDCLLLSSYSAEVLKF